MRIASVCIVCKVCDEKVIGSTEEEAFALWDRHKCPKQTRTTMENAVSYFMEWYKYWSPAGYCGCLCCSFTWFLGKDEEHATRCPVAKFKEALK